MLESNQLLIAITFIIIFLAFLCVSLLLPSPTFAETEVKTSGCFDKARFCFELTPSSGSLYLVSVKRKIAMPVALTLYSDKLFQIPSSLEALKPKAHVNAFLNTDDAVPLGVVKKANAFWHTMRVKWTAGQIDAQHDRDYAYYSPLQPASAYRIVQGFNGSFSHSGASRYALDFAAPVGTPILAARAGVVIDTKDDGTKGGPHSRLAKHANYVAILHSDGTTGEYYHLKHEGVRFQELRDQTLARRAAQYALYSEGLKSNAALRLQQIHPDAKHNSSYFPVVFADEAALLKVIAKLKTADIFPRRYFYPSLNKLDYVNGPDMPVSEHVSKSIICLPLYHTLGDENILKICEIINGEVG